MLKNIKYNATPQGFDIIIEALNNQFERVCVFNSNINTNHNKYLQSSMIIAVDFSREIIIANSENALEKLQGFINQGNDWFFGYLSYDIKNEIEKLASENFDGLCFPLLHFFVPKVVLKFDGDSIDVIYDDEFISEEEALAIFMIATASNKSNIYFNELEQTNYLNPRDGIGDKVFIQSKISKQEYINSVNILKQHILKGDIYEINFCQEFFAENTIIAPVKIFEKLNLISQAPFSAYCKLGKNYVLCASPERFLQKNGDNLIAQPIKGTIKRSSIKIEDDLLKMELKNSEKERSENVMIVDLVRNDLARLAQPGTVTVDELFGVYSFNQLHHMISTINCKLKTDTSFTDIIKCTFPMGSMTGAPKVSAMKLIESIESSKRGLFSGTIGYISPEGDFDFNVVIRSILYNSENKYLSFMVGSAITDKSVPENEYEECLLKANAMIKALA